MVSPLTIGMCPLSHGKLTDSLPREIIVAKENIARITPTGVKLRSHSDAVTALDVVGAKKSAPG